MGNSFNNDRRAFLAAAPALAILTAGPAHALVSPSASRAEWDAAMVCYIDAKIAEGHYDTTIAHPGFLRIVALEKANGVDTESHGFRVRCLELQEKYPAEFKRYDAICSEHERLCNVFSDAQMALMNMPSPDLCALRWKLDRVFDMDGNDSLQPWTLKFVGQTMADYRRLLGGAQS